MNEVVGSFLPETSGELFNMMINNLHSWVFSPHNPTGKVFSKDELDAIAGACCANDCLAITDEV